MAMHRGMDLAEIAQYATTCDVLRDIAEREKDTLSLDEEKAVHTVYDFLYRAIEQDVEERSFEGEEEPDL